MAHCFFWAVGCFMTLSVWLSLLMICVLGAMSPGPSLVVVAKHSLAGGRLYGIVASWAHALGVGLYAVMTLLGLALVLHQSPMVFKLISYGGALYLAYLGINALRSKGGVAAKLSAGEQVSLKAAVMDGLAISLLNPKLALFFLALFSQYVAIGSEFLSRATIVMTPLLVDGLWYTLIAFMLSCPKVLTFLRAKAQWIDRASGVVLLLLAARVVWGV